jgi:hypothetical protein
LQKRQNQRLAARLLDPSFSGSFRSDQAERSAIPVVERRSLKEPVLSPSTFILEDFNAAEWIRVQRYKNRRAALDSKIALRKSNLVSGRTTVISHRRSDCASSGANRGTSVFKNLEAAEHKALFGSSSVGPQQDNHKDFSLRPAQSRSPRLRYMCVHVGLPVPLTRSFVAAVHGENRVLAMDNRGDHFQRPMGGSNQLPPSRPPAPQSGNFGPMDGAGRVDSAYGARSANFPPQQFRGDGNPQFEFGSNPLAGNNSHNGWMNEQQPSSNQRFEGDFGNFDAGSNKGNQNFNGNQNNGYRRPFRQNFSGNRHQGGYRGYAGGNRAARPTVNRFIRPAVSKEPIPVASDNNSAGLRKTVINTSIVAPNGAETVLGGGSESSKGTRKSTLCFRCEESGHMASACKAILCVYCSKATHDKKDCHLLSMPKPTAITYGLCRSELLFHEVPVSDEVSFKHDSGKDGRINVEGGTLTAKELIRELEWIIPGDFPWDPVVIGPSAFRVMFPSKADLSRVKRIREVPIDNDMFLSFDEWATAPVDKYKLEEAWVRVSGCPYKLRCDYLGLFAVGSLIGKAKEIDMEFTREHHIVRMFVEVTSIAHIPKGTDHRYDGEGFGITFEVEGGVEEAGSDAIMQEANSEGDGKSSEKENSNGKNQSSANLQQTKPSSSSSQTGNVPPGVKQVQFGSVGVARECASASRTGSSRSWGVRADDEESLPSPVVRSAPPPSWFSKVSESERFVKIIRNQFSPAKGVAVTPPRPLALRQSPESAVSPSPSFPTADSFGESSVVAETVCPSVVPQSSVGGMLATGSDCSPTSVERGVSPGAGRSTPIGTGVFLGGRFSQEDIVTFGGISAEAQGARSSDRIRAQPNSDLTQLERAQALAQARNQLSPAGNAFVHKFSFHSMPTDLVVKTASKLGVSIGHSPSQINASVDLLKDIDLQRTLVMLKKSEDKISQDQEDPNSLVIHEAKALSSDLLVEEQLCVEGHKDHITPAPLHKKRNTAKKRAVSVVRRSARINRL